MRSFCFVLLSIVAPSHLGAASFHETVTPFLKTYCYDCHDASTQEAAVNLEVLAGERTLYTFHELTEAILHHVGDERDMPPEEMEQPSDAERAAVVAYLRDKLEHPDPAILDDPGFVPAHRLSNRQYRNTIRDLVGVGMEVVDGFPADEAVDGFDHMASAMTFSSMHMERYLAAAKYVVDRAFVPAEPMSIRVEAETLPFLETFGRQEYEKNAMFPDCVTKSEIDGEFYRLKTSGGVATKIAFPQSGYYDVNVRVQFRFVDGPVGGRVNVVIDGQKAGSITHLSSRAKKPTVLSTRVLVKRGTPDVRLEWEGMNTKADEPTADDLNVCSLDWFEVVGPVSENPKMHEQIAKQLMPVRASESVAKNEAVRRTVARFASRAFRRPASRAEVTRLVEFSGVSEGATYEEAVKRAMVATLASPHFLLHTERVGSVREAYELDHFEVANRLSYFLWSTMPDAELLRAAGEKTLHDADELAKQVDRMLADPKAAALAENFVPQWLELGSLFSVDRSGKEFKKFIRQRRGIREAMLNEAVLVCDEVFRSDKSLLTLLDADFTYVNKDTAEQYGIDGVKAKEMERVVLTGELASQRGGLPTMAAVLMSISHPSDTNPSGRGKWILDALLGTPPPPPPPDVQPLPKADKDASKLTLRERLAAHRDDPNCASCHEKIDPLGFALENYDQNGTWRSEEAGRAVDTQATLPDGTTIDGVVSLKRYLVEEQRELFLKQLSKRLLSYALRRGLEFHDRSTVNECVERLDANGERFRDLVVAVVTSRSFLMQRVPLAGGGGS